MKVKLVIVALAAIVALAGPAYGRARATSAEEPRPATGAGSPRSTAWSWPALSIEGGAGTTVDRVLELVVGAEGRGSRSRGSRRLISRSRRSPDGRSVGPFSASAPGESERP
jgi:hypothetical protein